MALFIYWMIRILIWKPRKKQKAFQAPGAVELCQFVKGVSRSVCLFSPSPSCPFSAPSLSLIFQSYFSLASKCSAEPCQLALEEIYFRA